MESISSSSKAWLMVAVLALVVIMAALGVIYSSFKSRSLTAEFARLQAERDRLQVERGQLLLEQSTWGSFNRVERLAGDKLNMQVPDPDQIVMVSPHE